MSPIWWAVTLSIAEDPPKTIETDGIDDTEAEPREGSLLEAYSEMPVG